MNSMENVKNLSIYQYTLEEYPSQLIKHNYWQKPIIKKMVWKVGKANNNKVILKIKAKKVQGYQWEYNQEKSDQEENKKWKICSRDCFRKSKGWNKKKYTFLVDSDDNIEELEFRCRVIVFEGSSLLPQNAVLSQKNWKWLPKAPVIKKITVKKRGKLSKLRWLIKASGKRVLRYCWQKRNSSEENWKDMENPYILAEEEKPEDLKFKCIATGYNRDEKSIEFKLDKKKPNMPKDIEGGETTESSFLEPKELKFLRWRKHDICITNLFYCLLLISSLVQTVVFFLRKEYVISLAKLIGAALACGSFHAWWEQLKKEEEFYGWALGNYSKDVPIYETMIRFKKYFRSLGKKILSIGRYILHIISFGKIENQPTYSQNEQPNQPIISPSMVIISDWLKNRPSVTYWLILMLSLTWIYKLFPEIKISFLTELLLNFVFFILSFPITSFKYAHKVTIHKTLGAIGFATAIFSIMFAMPLIIIRKLDPDTVFWGNLSVIGKDFSNIYTVFKEPIVNICKSIPVYLNTAWSNTKSAFASLGKHIQSFIDTYPVPSSFLFIAVIALAIVGILYFIARRTANKTKESDDRLIKAIEAQLKAKEDNNGKDKKKVVDCFGSLTGYGQKRFLRRILADLALSQAFRRLEIESDDFIRVSNNNEATELIQELDNITLDSKKGED